MPLLPFQLRNRVPKPMAIAPRLSDAVPECEAAVSPKLAKHLASAGLSSLQPLLEQLGVFTFTGTLVFLSLNLCKQYCKTWQYIANRPWFLRPELPEL